MTVDWFQIVAGVWLFALGSAIGSFLNVVAYRVPRGQTLVWSSSRCPSCQRPILLIDNIPVVSWFVLRGRCRRCQSPISPRYPLVEFLTGLIFLSLFVLQVNDRDWDVGALLLENDAATAQDFARGWQLAAQYVAYCFLLSALWVSFLLAWDDYPMPKRMMVGLGLAGVLFVCVPGVVPPVAPGPANRSPEWSWADRAREGALGLLMGSALAVAAGWLPRPLTEARTGTRRPQRHDHSPTVARNTRFGLVLAGLLLGWWHAVAVAMTGLALGILLSRAAAIAQRSRAARRPQTGHRAVWPQVSRSTGSLAVFAATWLWIGLAHVWR